VRKPNADGSAAAAGDPHDATPALVAPPGCRYPRPQFMQWIAPSEKDTATTTLEKRLWDSADQFRANSGQAECRIPKCEFGIAGSSSFEIRHSRRLWIQLFHSALNAKGRAGFVMANSASDVRASEQEIRQKLIEGRAVDVMVAVGPNMFYTATLPCTLWFFDKGKERIHQAKARRSRPGKRASFLRASSCSHTRNTRQPARRNLRDTSASRARLPAILGRQ